MIQRAELVQDRQAACISAAGVFHRSKPVSAGYRRTSWHCRPDRRRLSLRNRRSGWGICGRRCLLCALRLPHYRAARRRSRAHISSQPVAVLCATRPAPAAGRRPRADRDAAPRRSHPGAQRDRECRPRGPRDVALLEQHVLRQKRRGLLRAGRQHEPDAAHVVARRGRTVLPVLAAAHRPWPGVPPIEARRF